MTGMSLREFGQMEFEDIQLSKEKEILSLIVGELLSRSGDRFWRGDDIMDTLAESVEQEYIEKVIYISCRLISLAPMECFC